jgi:hypothetical protein
MLGTAHQPLREPSCGSRAHLAGCLRPLVLGRAQLEAPAASQGPVIKRVTTSCYDLAAGRGVRQWWAEGGTELHAKGLACQGSVAGELACHYLHTMLA